MENTSDFNKYPHRIFASVVLLDGKIFNWKTGNSRWTKENYLWSRQPRIVCKRALDVVIKSKSWMVKNLEEHNDVFENKSKKFYRKFPVQEDAVPMLPYHKTTDEKKKHFKASLEGASYIVPEEQVGIIIEEIKSAQVGDVYSLEKIEMTDEEFKKLPEFTGF